MMKHYLLPEQGTFYKSNLHCHTTISDGKQTPEEVKRDFQTRGYSIVAYTDHDVMIPHHDLTDENFLALTGYEMEVNELKPGHFKFKKSAHMCLIALDPDKREQVCFHRSRYLIGNAMDYFDQLHYDRNEPDYVRVYSHEGVSEMMRIGRENGFFVTYNHPNWSLETAADFMGYEHMHAMEIYNRGGADYGDYNNGKEYDQMLRGGKRLFCIAADDNHSLSSSFGGFTMIKAPRLDYKTVTGALVAGNFYSSLGPEIHGLWMEDGRIHITCSDAQRIIMTTGNRRIGRACAPEGGVINGADFEVQPEDQYVRLTVYDRAGLYAATNAYFTDELLD